MSATTGDTTTGDTSASTNIPTRWEPTSIKIYNPTLLRTDNYLIWRLEAQIHLDNIDVWELVSGAEVKPTTDTHDNWKRKNRQALSLLIQMVTDEYKGLIGNNNSSASAWKILEDTLDRKSVTSTIYPVNQVFDMKKTDAKSWTEHIAEFESRWTNVNSKVSTATTTSKPWIQGLQLAFSDAEFKAHLLLRTLPPNMDNIVDNLLTKETLSYTDVWTKLLDLSHDTPAGSALATYQKPPKKSTNKGKNTASSSGSSSLRPGIPPAKECSYCWKRHLHSKGHQHTECAVLKKAFEEKKAAAGTGSGTGAAKIAKEADVQQGYALMTSTAGSFLSANPFMQAPPPLAPAPLAPSSPAPPPLTQRPIPSGLALSSAENKTFEVWTFDTASSHHITADLSVLLDPTLDATRIEVGDGRKLVATHVGTVKFDVMDDDGSVISFSLSDVLYIPVWASSSLISWRKIAYKCRLTGEDDWISVYLKNGKRLFSVRSVGPNLYELPALVKRGKAYLSTVQFWHEALGHSSPQTWSHAVDRYPDGNLIPPHPSKFFCPTCAQSNARNITPAPTNNQQSSVCYDLVHTDLAGPFTVQSIGGSLYYMTIIDDTSRYAHIYFLKKKSDACKHLKEYSELVHNKTGRYPRIIRSDRGGEYVNTEWNDYCFSKGIQHQITPAYSPQSNGVAERFNLTIANMSKSALLPNAPPKFL